MSELLKDFCRAALANLGNTLMLLEQYSESLESLQAALNIFRKIGYRSAEAITLHKLAILHLILEKLNLAHEFCARALSIAIELNIPLAKECRELKELLVPNHE